MKSLLFAALLSILCIGSKASAGLHEGVEAYQKGDYRLAIQELSPLARQGDRYAQLCLGVMYLDGGHGVQQDDEQATKWLRLAADQGDDLAQVSLGHFYSKRDHEEAAKWFRLAAEQGTASAQRELALLYFNGTRFPEGEFVAKGTGLVPRDDKEAAKWFRLAAEQGDAISQSKLGVMYAYGRGMPVDYKQAAKWYRLAAEQGDDLGQVNLGVIYANGKGVAQDYKEAVKWFRLAADQGSSSAQRNLGAMFVYGNGVPENRVAACALLDLAVAAGAKTDGSLTELHGLLPQTMTKNEIKASLALTQQMAEPGNLLKALDQYVKSTVTQQHRDTGLITNPMGRHKQK